MLPAFSQNLTLNDSFETVAELKRTEFDGTFCNKNKFVIDRFSSVFGAKRRNSVEKMIYEKKNRDHSTSKIVKSRQSYSYGHLPIIVHFII